MRAPAIAPADLPAALRPLYDDMHAGIERSFKGFVAIRGDGALVGPWAPWLRHAKFGGPVWELTKALASNPALPGPVREVAILVTGAHFRAGYELYAHVIVAEQRGLPDAKLATIVAGQRPGDLTRAEAIAYDMAASLVAGGVLPELIWRAAVAEWGESGAAELSYLIGLYCMVSVTLNSFAVPVPETAG
jgi:alkylhydroperoxidase family enzyme